MAITFHVLASGSAGNASLLDLNGFGVLIDFGIGPRMLAQRLKAVDYTWDQIRVALLTHTHTDHWSKNNLAHFARRRIPLYCHREHAPILQQTGEIFDELDQLQLIRDYEIDEELDFFEVCRCAPFAVSHDAVQTCGFRFDSISPCDHPWSLAYAADLGCWDEYLAQEMCDVDVLALEFNHDINMQRKSGRPYILIRRVLGDLGHLSNEQARDLVRAVAQQSDRVGLRHLVQLHLSRECNLPILARAVAKQVLREIGRPTQLHTASQTHVGPSLRLDVPRAKMTPTAKAVVYQQLRLPGWDD